MKHLLYSIHYFSAPLVRESGENHLVLESIRNRVWNPVFAIGAITFILSMTLRGFFDQHFAVLPLGLSTLVLFSGVWILSATALVVFDRNESKIYFVYKHLGYLQKVYLYPMTSVEQVLLTQWENGRSRITLQRDNGNMVKVAQRKEKKRMEATANQIAGFLKIPLKTN